ncbi:MAG TPA: hypothetical protein VGL69_14355 [Solirubrobacteraceae bacterium]|jgi:hypothetical protein
MNTARARGTAIRRAAPGGRRSTTAQGSLHGLVGRAATELERMRPAAHHRGRRSRSESIIERIKHLV